MANVFPTIQTPDYPLHEIRTDHTLKMKVENETILTRPKLTKVPKAFKLTWSELPTEDFIKLKNFWESMHGGALIFQWTYPTDEGNDYSGKTFNVRFDDDELDWSLVKMNYWSVSLTLRVAP